jgi:drug/metabolite transporter (DMT)-like permease
MLLALQCAVVSAISMMLGLLRWPSIHWRLAELYVAADPAQRQVLGATFDGLNLYLGNYLGEFLGELSFSAFFFLSAWVLLRSRKTSRWLALGGLLTGGLGWIGMFRNLTTAVAPVAAINNYLLPLWMIAFGIVLLRYREQAVAAAELRP